jgi:hypothetical protein
MSDAFDFDQSPNPPLVIPIPPNLPPKKIGGLECGYPASVPIPRLPRYPHDDPPAASKSNAQH